MVIKELKASNGVKVIFEETPYYYKVTVGKKTWYWNRDTGKYDGVSFDWKGINCNHAPFPIHEQFPRLLWGQPS